jgi:dTDP-4-dehydrorhamnose reductase
MKIATTGWQGRLGSELLMAGCIPLDCDVTDQISIQNALEDIDPDVVINCAAITAVDACEAKETYDKAVEVNYKGVINLLNAFPKRVIHISTSYVFDGKHGNYKETDYKYNPVNAYAITKVAAEAAFNAFRVSRPYNDMIIRTVGLYGKTVHDDFVKYVRRSLSNKTPVNAAKDLYSNNTYIPHLAEAIMSVVNNSRITVPILHIASSDVVSRYELSKKIVDVFGLDDTLLSHINMKNIDGWVAKRPKRGGLNVDLAKRLGVPIYSIMDGLKALKEYEDEQRI